MSALYARPYIKSRIKDSLFCDIVCVHESSQALMGIVRIAESEGVEWDEFRRMLLACAGRKGEEEERKRVIKGGDMVMWNEIDPTEKTVGVTGGVSFLGLAVVNRLLVRGYFVRIIVHHQEDIEKLREMETSGAMGKNNNNIKAVMANLNEVHSLMQAFDGCRGLFHTSSFVDLVGLSGYSKSMAEVELKASENVIEACARTPSVRKCVLNSSLLACIWQDGSLSDLSPIINHDSWSNESLCIDKKLWYALGKLRAEKAAWRIAEQTGLKLTSICPGLITGPNYYHRNPTATIAYLKGAQEMYAYGLLATVDVNRLAEAHISVYEASTASGRYVCFDRVIMSEDGVEKLARETGMEVNRIVGNGLGDFNIELSNRKLSILMSRTMQYCCNESK